MSMYKKMMKSRRFKLYASVVGVMLVIFLAGYITASNQANKLAKSQLATINNLRSQLKSLQTVDSTNEFLSIKQWSIKLGLPTSISDATYFIEPNAWDGYPTAFLSTAKLDNSPACQKFLATNPAQASFQWIERYALYDTVYPNKTLGGSMSAAKAATAYPNQFKRIGNYVYGYAQGNGPACPGETFTMLNAFQSAFNSMVPIQ